LTAKLIVVHAHYKGEPPKRSDFNVSFEEKDKVYRCGKCKKVVAGVEQGRLKRLYVLAKDVVVSL